MSQQIIHVAAAVIYRGDKILIARRPDHLHQGGLWEFPGGKVELGEAVEDALVRELAEELDIEATHYSRLIRIPHDYGDRKVLLDVWRVTAFEGEPHGHEGQETRWVVPEQLADYEFPAANHPILMAVALPDHCLVTPEPNDHAAFLADLEASLQQGVRLVQLRAKQLGDEAYLALAAKVAPLCRRYHARLLLNTSPQRFESSLADGLHLSTERLMALKQRPLGEAVLLSAACHNRQQVEQANHIGVDMILVSPVQATATHPEARPLGWQGLHELTEAATMPVYALGGMERDDIHRAQGYGAQGIAAIRALWQGSLK